jgi:hypothetical protein
MRVPYPDQHILTWRFMGGGIKVGRSIGSSQDFLYSDKPILTWCFRRGVLEHSLMFLTSIGK